MKTTSGLFSSLCYCALVFMLSSGLIAMTGCASKYGAQTVKVQYYTDCYKPIEELRKDEADLKRNTAAGAAAGGLLGAIAGYQMGGARGAVIGAAGGAIIGGMSAYLLTDQIQQKNQAERFAAYSEAFDQDIKGLGNAVAAARLTNKCYENAYKTLSRQYKAGQISKEEMLVRLKEQRDGTYDANTVLAKFSADIAQNQIVYNDIPKAEAKQGRTSLSSSQMNALTSQTKRLDKLQNEAQIVSRDNEALMAALDRELINQTAQGEGLMLAKALKPMPMLCPALKS